MILDKVKEQLGEMSERKVMLVNRIADCEESLVNARKGMQEVQDEIALCELLLSVADGLSTGTPSAITPKAVESMIAVCASETYANPEILVSRWKNGDLKTVVLNVMKREPKRWFKPCDILGEIAKQHKRVAHSGSLTTVLGRLRDDRVIHCVDGKYTTYDAVPTW